MALIEIWRDVTWTMYIPQLIIFLSLYISYCYVSGKIYRKYHKLPPGPESIFPYIGYQLNTLFNPNTFHIDLAKYGPVSSIYRFGHNMFVINDAKIAKKLLSNTNLLDRDPSLVNNNNVFNIFAAKDNTANFLVLNGNQWNIARQAMHNKLIRVINTKKANYILNKSIQNELVPYLDKVINEKNGIFKCREILTYLAFNVIFEANFDVSMEFKNNKLYKQLSKDLMDVTSDRIMNKFIIQVLIPFFKKIPYFMNELIDIRQRIHDNISIMLKQNKLKTDYASSQTFANYTEKMKECEEISESRQIADIFLMFLAGTDTTAITLEWGLILISRQQDIQIKVRKELQCIINKNNLNPKEALLFDIKLLLQLPLFRALIHEILRISSVVRLGIQHHYIKDKEIWININHETKYKIPKKTTIWYNVDFIHNYSQSENWKNKNDNLSLICLENWLVNDNNNNNNDDAYKFVKNDSFISFGHGRRDCIGKQLAMKELRIILAYLLLNYKFKLCEKHMVSCRDGLTCKGGVRVGVCKIKPEIPIIISKIH